MQEKPDITPSISKTKLKAEADAQQAIGRRLIDLPKDKLNKLNLPESLFDAVIEAKRLTANGAIRRQLQFIGRLMRDIDSEPIVDQLARWDGKHNEENARFHVLERWRDRLLNQLSSQPSSQSINQPTGADHALQEFVNLYPHAEIQQLRNLCRNAQKELINNKPPKSSRELFKLLREITEQSAIAPPDDL